MNIFRFEVKELQVLALRTDDDRIYALPHNDFLAFVKEARRIGVSALEYARQIARQNEPLKVRYDELHIKLPIEAQEVWAAGVTYERSREARNYEAGKVTSSQAAVTVYDRVYEADRPELFLKSTPLRTVGPGEEMCLRTDSRWQVPEPELGLVLDSDGTILGYTIGNDLSSRDIEGENPLYLPQAKIWRRSCSIGPSIRLAEAVENPYDLTIICRIYRNGEPVVEGSIRTSQFKRKLEDLVAYLVRDNDLHAGTVLLTGTGIVPPDDFTLMSGDRVDITIPGIGTLSNPIH